MTTTMHEQPHINPLPPKQGTTVYEPTRAHTAHTLSSRPGPENSGRSRPSRLGTWESSTCTAAPVVKPCTSIPESTTASAASRTENSTS